MPDIGRWGVHDPLSELQFAYSPYSYVYGNPIKFNDPTGMIMGGSNLVASAGWATLDAVVDYQDPEDQEAIQVVQLAAIGLQLKHGNVKALQNLVNEAEEVTISSVVKKDAKILKLAQETFKGNDLLRKEANALIEQLKLGNINPGIGTKNIGKNVFEARSRGGARVYFRNSSNGVEIVGYSHKGNQQQVINHLLKDK